MFRHKKIYDISVAYGNEAIDYPGDISFSRVLHLDRENGDAANVSTIRMSCHSGTHLDLPSHFIRAGKTVTDYLPENFILRAHVIEINDAGPVMKEHILPVRFNKGEAVLFKTDNSRLRKVTAGTFSEDYVYISTEAADYLAQNRAGLVGIDYSTVEQFGDTRYPVHDALLKNGIFILEGINLESVPAGRYILFCLPLKIDGGEASPVRAILIK